MSNIETMEQRAKDLKVLIDKLHWPEAQGPYFILSGVPHVLYGHRYTISINYNTAMFALADASRFKFIDIPDTSTEENKDMDIVAWLACEFLSWVQA